MDYISLFREKRLFLDVLVQDWQVPAELVLLIGGIVLFLFLFF